MPSQKSSKLREVVKRLRTGWYDEQGEVSFGRGSVALRRDAPSTWRTVLPIERGEGHESENTGAWAAVAPRTVPGLAYRDPAKKKREEPIVSSNNKERDVKGIDRRNFLIAGAVGIAAAGIDVNTALAQPEKAAAPASSGASGTGASGKGKLPGYAGKILHSDMNVISGRSAGTKATLQPHRPGSPSDPGPCAGHATCGSAG